MPQRREGSTCPPQTSVRLRDKQVDLVHADAFTGMATYDDNAFDFAIVDPPYGASTSKSWKLPEGHGLQGFGGKWDIASHQWDRLRGLDSFEFTLVYLSELKRLIKPTGSFFVHSTYHNAGIVNVACQLLGLEIINEIVWFKRNAFPNLANRRLTASHETIYWVHTGADVRRQYRFNADAVRSTAFPEDSVKSPGKQMRTVWDVPNNKHRNELAHGKHPTQKPLRLSERLFIVAGTPGGAMLAPFAGSGTELVAAARYCMDAIGF